MGVGKRIKYIRKKRGLTLEEVSQRSGLYKSNISEIENEKRFKPNLLTLERLAGALECTVEDFFTLCVEYDEEMAAGLSDFLADKKIQRMMRVTDDEIDWLKSVRFRSHQRPTKETYIDLLDTYRKLEEQ